MARQTPLVLQHLENISGRVLEEYPKIVQQMIRGRAGIYALYRRDKLYYVGLASNLMGRIKHHLVDRHRGLWDRFSVYLTAHNEHIKELESLLLRVVSPSGNKSGGKFAESESLLRTLNASIKDSDDSHRAQILGGYIAEHHRQSKLRKGKGKIPLAGIVEHRITLRATFDRRKYRATLRKDGKISFRKKLYESPTAAAEAITRRAQNGWRFWLYRNKKGNWVPLNEMKG